MTEVITKITSVWESPTNEGTQSFHVGSKRYDRAWTTGEIKFSTDQEQSRICVYDTEGMLRVDMPYATCCVEYGEGE
jgi:hypothetical protein